ALVQNGSSVTTVGSVTVTANDSSTIVGDAGGFSLALRTGQGSSSTVAIGAAFAVNSIDTKVEAAIDGSTVESSTSDVTVAAMTEATISALTIGGAGAINTGEGGLNVSGAGAGSGNKIKVSTKAGVRGGSRVKAADDVTVTAEDK